MLSTNRDAKDGSSPSGEFWDKFDSYQKGRAYPSELLMAAHRDSLPTSWVDSQLGNAGSVGQADDDGNTGADYDIPAAKKLASLEEAKEATAELAKGKAELAEEKAELAEEAGNPEAAEAAEEAAESALEKGKSALESKAKTAGKIAIGTAIGQGLTNIERATGGSGSYDTSALNALPVSQPSAKEPAGDTADDMRKRLDDASGSKKPVERPTTNLGRWGQ